MAGHLNHAFGASTTSLNSSLGGSVLIPNSSNGCSSDVTAASACCSPTLSTASSSIICPQLSPPLLPESPGWLPPSEASTVLTSTSSPGPVLPVPSPLVSHRIQRIKDAVPLLKCHSADDTLLRNKCGSGSKEIYYEDREVVSGVSIKSATVEKIAEEVIKKFDVTDNIEVDTTFPKIIFLMHKWFMSSASLAEHFVRFASVNKNDQSADSSSFNCNTVSRAFSFWIEHYPTDFLGDFGPMTTVNEFARSLEALGREDLTDMIETRLNTSYDWSRGLSVRYPVRMRGAESDSEDLGTLVFNQIEPQQLANQLTTLEFKAFRRITFDDLKQYAITGSLKGCTRLERSIYLFNGVSQWAQCMILSKTTPAERARTIVKFVDIAKCLLEHQNFNTFYAVVGGITHSAIGRLGKTMTSIPEETQKMLIEYAELLSSSDNFAGYRRRLHQAKGFAIPVLGVHLKDIVFFHIALHDWIGQRLVNVRKFAQLSATFACILDQQLQSLPVEENTTLCNTLRLSLDLQYTEEEIYELSLAREPRNLVSPTTPTRSVVFAEWIAGVRPPDPNTLKKHVNDMVEAVFKVYDNDKDGLISSAEFELVAENFPFIDSFAVVDADCDGAISKAEMKMYFIKANCNALKNSFKHDFIETTYFKPTFCAHCTGLLWGLIRQGWKCRDCGINAHKHCKDRMVMECRHRAHNGLLHLRSNSSPGAADQVVNSGHITAERKRRMSMRHKRSMIVSTGCQTSPSCETLVEWPSNSCSPSNDKEEYYEEAGIIYERLLRAEEERDLVRKENTMLRQKMECQASQLANLRDHLARVRRRTIVFILGLMDALNIQRDSEV